jgi:hypothetical protein
MKELVIIGEAGDPPLYVERRAYLQALRAAVAGSRGRMALAKAPHRLNPPAWS